MVELGGCSFSSDEGSLDFIGTQKTFTEEVLSVSPIDPPDNSIIVVESTSIVDVSIPSSRRRSKSIEENAQKPPKKKNLKMYHYCKKKVQVDKVIRKGF